ncbi:hypothetical protein BJY00DRAFT_8528 [Aspergillus carlsbadensis]|nr:hypothetical protein BJY00DRAFT_8528 [Aspergillus carlsbadensis]
MTAKTNQLTNQMSKMSYTTPCTAKPKCEHCAPLYTDLYPRFGASKLTVPTPKSYPMLFTNTFSLATTPASLNILSTIENMESAMETFIRVNSFPESRDLPVPVYRLLTINDMPGPDAESMKRLMKDNTKGKEVSLTLTILVDFPEKQHIGPEKMGWLFGEFPGVPLSSWERRGPDEGATRHASLARLEFWKQVFNAEVRRRVVFVPE